MRLRGIDFGSVIGASGVQGFFGEGYPYHRLYETAFPWGFGFTGMTFTAKTVTLERKEGNMPLCEDGITPRERFPKCIHVSPRSFLQGAALNAVGLSNFGAEFYLKTRRWHARTDNFFISFMSVKEGDEAKFQEWKEFVLMLSRHLPYFQGKVACQINYSCPNVGKGALSHEDELLERVCRDLSLDSFLRMPLVPKISIAVSPGTAARIAMHPACDALCVSNTLPWGAQPVGKTEVDWKGLFGTNESPLKRFGGGGLSGSPLLPPLTEWLKEARPYIKKPIIIGGGVMSPADVRAVSGFGPGAVSLGSIAMLRPWRLKATIEAANTFI